ncbi:uncharacterized protein F5891DRAFT_965633, partial [Suillus fuscotomentosus]
VNLGWMGGFMQSSDICEKLFCTGVPAWYVHTSAYIPLKMMVVEPVLLTCPDHIIIAIYTEGRKICPFEVIYHGQGGRNRHMHIHCLYAGMTYQDPESDKSSQLSSSLSCPASGPKLSALGKAPKQKGKQWHRCRDSCVSWCDMAGFTRKYTAQTRSVILCATHSYLYMTRSFPTQRAPCAHHSRASRCIRARAFLRLRAL